jgi:predicted acyl esterase
MIKKWAGILVVLILLGLLAFYKFPKGTPDNVIIERRVLATPTRVPRASNPNVYKGYPPRLYHDVIKTSQYITVRDGTRLAADIYRTVQGASQ